MNDQTNRPEPETNQRVAAAIEAFARGEIVVVADDDAGFRQMVKSLLAGIADRVIEAEDGAQALAAVAADHVDLVLTDLSMPEVDGHALLERLPDGLPAIVITGLDVAPPPRAAALLRKEELTRERLAFAIRRVQVTR